MASSLDKSDTVAPHWPFPLAVRTYLPSLHLFGGHHDHPGVLLEHHAPKVADGVLQAALRGDVALLHLGAVALLVLLRLQRHNRTRAQKHKRSVPLHVLAIAQGKNANRLHKHSYTSSCTEWIKMCELGRVPEGGVSFSFTVAAEFTMMILALM